MLIRIEDPVIEIVEAPELYHTPIDVVGSVDSAERVVELLVFLQGWTDLRRLLAPSLHDVLVPVFGGLVRRYLPFVEGDDVSRWTGLIINHVWQYDSFLKSEPSYSVKSSGLKFKVDGGSMLFNTRQEAVNFHITHSVNWNKFEIVEGV